MRRAAAKLRPPLFLNKGDRNVPDGSVRPRWNRKQWFTRRAVMDRLRLWQSSRYQCLWVTLSCEVFGVTLMWLDGELRRV
jgi:hypothetical protein